MSVDILWFLCGHCLCLVMSVPGYFCSVVYMFVLSSLSQPPPPPPSLSLSLCLSVSGSLSLSLSVSVCLFVSLSLANMNILGLPLLWWHDLQDSDFWQWKTMATNVLPVPLVMLSVSLSLSLSVCLSVCLSLSLSLSLHTHCYEPGMLGSQHPPPPSSRLSLLSPRYHNYEIPPHYFSVTALQVSQCHQPKTMSSTVLPVLLTLLCGLTGLHADVCSERGTPCHAVFGLDTAYENLFREPCRLHSICYSCVGTSVCLVWCLSACYFCVCLPTAAMSAWEGFQLQRNVCFVCLMCLFSCYFCVCIRMAAISALVGLQLTRNACTVLVINMHVASPYIFVVCVK